MGKERRMSQESEYKKLDEEKARLHEENEQYRRQLKNRFGSDDGFRIQYEELEQEYNIILEENRSLNKHANNKIMPLGVGSESTEDTLHQHHHPPPPIKVPTATTTYDLACDSSITANQLIAHLLRFYITDIEKVTLSSSHHHHHHHHHQQQQHY